MSYIVDILKKEKKDDSINELYYSCQEKYIVTQGDYVSIPHNCKENMIIIFYTVNDSLISKIIYNDGKVEDNGSYFSNLFDIYSIIKN